MSTTTTYSQQSQDYYRIEQAIQYLEDNFQNQPNLDEIAESVHLSKYHFQRLFKRWAGVTPAQFLHYLTISYAKEKLSQSQPVLETALDAGLSGSGRLHDLFVTFEAMTPGEYKQRGSGIKIRYAVHPTPFGDCLIGMTNRGICALRFLNEANREAEISGLQAEWPLAELVWDEAETAVVIDAIFAQATPQKPFHLFLKGTNFQVQVWQALLNIPSGQIVTYSGLAEQIGKLSATRAVASAVAKNPIGYLIPCHRVISKAGKMHQYRWGPSRKKAIVGWEAAQVG
ncbi:MAG: methylated-DNA--[protein]-cysteine S-methyltransferase [Chloroflexota bacterium]